MSGPSSFSVAFDFCAASRRACRSALPIAGSSRSMINLRMAPPFENVGLRKCRLIATRLRSAGKVRHYLLGEEPHRGERVIQRDHVEIDLQRGVLIITEGVLRAANLADDLFRRTNPGSVRANLIRRPRLPKLRHHLVAARIIL